MKKHKYIINLKWTGNLGNGTANYNAYSRNYEVNVDGKNTLNLSSDPNFRGDKSKYNPEELLLISVSACHQLWYLHLCADNGIVVESYEDNPVAIMIEDDDGKGKFDEIILNIKLKINEKSDYKKAIDLHQKANEMCFIANTLNIKVNHIVEIIS